MSFSPPELTEADFIAPGFRATGIAAGIKGAGKLDFALITSEKPCAAAAVFTSNVVQASSVKISKKHLQSSRGIRAVVATSGNANAANGQVGDDAVQAVCAALAARLKCSGEDVLVCQTGLIGKPFDPNPVVESIPAAVASLSSTGGLMAARAMMTTDTRVKGARVQFLASNGKQVTLCGVAKGAAMLSPSLATMLVVLTTDAAANSETLTRALKTAVADSFNTLIVDGCRSTNDTVFLLANGASEAEITKEDFASFQEAVREICISIAKQMAFDAEGATKFLCVRVVGAANFNDARQVARAVAGSALVKCSLAGESVYPGRVMSEAGAAGVCFDPNELRVLYGPYEVSSKGTIIKFNEAELQSYMQRRSIEITVSIGAGSGIAEAYGCDLTHAYIDENMGKS